MHIEVLHEFIVLAEELNYRTAAERLCTTQSTLSKHISALERHYGARLVDRSSTHVALTSRGQLLLECAQPLWQKYERSLELIRGTASGSKTLFISGSLDNPEDFPLVSRTIERFRRNHPNRTPHLVPSQSLAVKDQLQMLRSGEAGCAVFDVTERMAADAVEAGEVCYRRIGRIPLRAVVAESSPLAEKPLIGIDDLNGHTLVQMVGPRVAIAWEQLRQQLDVARVRYDTTLFAASTPYDYMNLDPGRAVFIIPRAAGAATGGARPGCVDVPVDPSELFLTLGALWLRDAVDQDVIEGFLACLAECFAEAYGEE